MQKINLSGTWNLIRPADGSEVAAAVPGDNISALFNAGKIADPYVAMNELDVQWIGREDWIFRRDFEVPAEFLREEHIFLNCDCLDTIAEVCLNGTVIGHANNMFRRWRFDAKPQLKAGRNILEIRFRGPETEACRYNETLPYPIPYTPAPVFSPHRNLLRKVQCHAGWDWGCCLMVSGIYQDIWLGATSAAVIDHVYTEQKHTPGTCTVTVTAEITAIRAGSHTLKVNLGDAEVVQTVELAPGHNRLSLDVTIKAPRLWYPNGYGEQPLYDLTVRIAGCESRKRLGLRKLELITEEDKHGLSFWFKVNGIPIFCKGANWIPVDAMPARQTRAVYDDLLTSAAAAHMNMLRVWGGGQYELNDFYELCDEKGILVWHDFMFSCALYPATPDFLANVRAEVEYQVKRLRDHACIALWCGNNEDIGALNWFEEPRRSRDRYLVDYDRLNEGAVGSTVDACDPTRVFWPSSPSAGRGDYTDCFHDDSRGDMHYWHVWHQGKSFDAYYDVIPRFCSEFGYQSFPSLSSIRGYAPPEQFNVTAPVMEHHQRHSGGNSRIVEMFSRYFRMPAGFANFVYLSQVQQAVAIKTAVEYWRHLQPVCMGTLYWQLNDLWPVCSWASIEYGGNWKLLHYAARRFYAPMLLCAFQRQENVEIWLVNDLQTTQAAQVTLEVLDFEGRRLFADNAAVDAAAGGAVLVKQYRVAELIDKPDTGFLQMTLNCDDGAACNTHFFTEYKRCDLAKANVTWQVSPAGTGSAVRLETDRPAFFVSLDAEGMNGVFSDNCFTLLPGMPREIEFTPKTDGEDADLSACLRVYHLRQSYE
jgi:beta-mannosidase